MALFTTAGHAILNQTLLAGFSCAPVHLLVIAFFRVVVAPFAIVTLGLLTSSSSAFLLNGQRSSQFKKINNESFKTNMQIAQASVE